MEKGRVGKTSNTDVELGSMTMADVRELLPVKEITHLIEILLARGHSRSATVTMVGSWLNGVCEVPNSPLLHVMLSVWVGAAELRRTKDRAVPVRTGPPPVIGSLASAPTVEPSNPRARLSDPLPPDQDAEYDGTKWTRARGQGTDEVPFPMPSEKE